ncbi:hypothetical protein O181_015944 [Austropuccinia psidii MF-1]|uniref:Uncharacterized protein n=1 Tax=Austropuccinia psidii MF-1 TaxID=1389203 RepID=A0A9Q3GRB2_9BASI|nr:hypothetical protein [Austropuccinia psidii MF-1]
MDLDKEKSHKSQRQEFQPRGEAQMGDSKASTSSKGLIRTFETLHESPEAEITTNPVVISEQLPGRRSRDIPVSVQDCFMVAKQQKIKLLQALLIGTINSYLPVKNLMVSEKTQEPLQGFNQMSFKGKVKEVKAWLNNQSILSEDQRKKLAQKKERTLWKLPKPPKAIICLQKCQTKTSKPQKLTRRASQRQR